MLPEALRLTRTVRDPPSRVRFFAHADDRAGGRCGPSVDRSAPDDPLRWLTSDACDAVEIGVVMQDRERGGLGDGRNEEIGDLTSRQSIGSELTLNLLRAIKVTRFDLKSPERSEGNGEAVPLLVYTIETLRYTAVWDLWQ